MPDHHGINSSFAPVSREASRGSERPAGGLESFATLINKRLMLPSQKTNYIAVEANFLVRALKYHVEEIFFDEAWYLAKYPDVRVAIASNVVSNGREHYALHGYYEHRMSHHIAVDEQWYLAQYPDVKKAVAEKEFSSGAAHFEEQGYREGRLPFQNFTLNMITDS